MVGSASISNGICVLGVHTSDNDSSNGAVQNLIPANESSGEKDEDCRHDGCIRRGCRHRGKEDATDSEHDHDLDVRPPLEECADHFTEKNARVGDT